MVAEMEAALKPNGGSVNWANAEAVPRKVSLHAGPPVFHAKTGGLRGEPRKHIKYCVDTNWFVIQTYCDE